MGANENIKVVKELQQAARDRDEKRYSELLADDAVFRVAGVPRALGGVTEGRDQILANFRQQGAPAGQSEIRDVFADDNHVCAMMKVPAPSPATSIFVAAATPSPPTSASSTG